MKQVPYASAVGSLMYAMMCTRLDISYVVSITSRYQSNPRSEHWGAVKTVLKYLKRTKDMFLVYRRTSELQLEAYTNLDFQFDPDDRKSTSGFVLTLNGGAISWKSCKQDVTANSTTEAEYVTASITAKEVVWMRKFISKLGVVPTIKLPVPLYCDNTGAIAQAKEPRSHQRNKHIERRFHVIKEFITDEEVKILKVASVDNTSDPFTKAMSQAQVDRHLEKMSFRYISNWL